ncbi:hypothetical protein GJAV_G00081980 [Gymnothorax javanicus]|nr:hypothetical protein GJAV_G00081980 [Gymnothorax javanicus]
MKAIHVFLCLILWRCINAEESEILCKVDPSSDIQNKARAAFYPGETAEVDCKQSFRTKTKKQQDTVTCTENGWSFHPFCEAIECRIAQEPNVIWSHYYYHFRYKDTVTSSYFSCQEGYRPSHGSMCDVGGWVPPLCEAITCEPEIPNAVILSESRKYTISERLEYKCHPFHEPEGRQVTYCTKNGWYKNPQCRAMIGFCQRPDLKNGYVISHESNPSVIYYGCLPGFKPSVGGWWGELTCQGKKWPQLPKCIASPDMCSPPPHVEYATITSTYKTKYLHLSKVQYKCKELYELHGNSEVTCRHGSWSTIPKCIRSECISPDDKIKNAVIAYKKVGPYKNGTEVDYQCEDKFHSEGQTKAMCINGDWHYPHCIAKDYCENPYLTNGFVKFSGEGEFREGAILDYECYQPCKRKTDERIICKNGRWDPPAECTCPQLKCEDPPIPENGDIIKQEEKDGGTEVTYQCKLGYKLKNNTKVKCLQGEWRPLPVCLRPCVIEEIDPKYNLQNPWKKTYLLHGDKMKIHCKRHHWNFEDQEYFIEVVCQDGEVEYKSCQRY